MKKFKFYQDQKVTQWERLFFEVKAKNYPQAVQKIKQFRNEDIINFEDDTLKISHLERVDDTKELMTLSQNDCCSTLELFNEQGEFIADNTNAKPNGSYEVVSVSIEDLQELGFDTSKVTILDLQHIARKMDLSEIYWDRLEYIAKQMGMKLTNKKTA